MGVINFLKAHKKEVIIAVLSTSLTATFAFSSSLWGIKRTFELNQKRELLNTLRADLYLLKKINNELELNLKLLSNQNFIPDIEFKPVPNFIEQMTNKANNLEMSAQNKENSEKMFEMLAPMKFLYADNFSFLFRKFPRQSFIYYGWHYTYSANKTEIDIPLLLDLNDFFRKLYDVNQSIDNIKRLTNENNFIHISKVNQVRSQCALIKQAMEEITHDKLTKLNERIKSEIKRIEGKLKKNEV